MKDFDTIKVGAAAVGATGIAIADINAYLTFCSLLIAIVYGLRKWYLMEKNNGNNIK